MQQALNDLLHEYTPEERLVDIARIDELAQRLDQAVNDAEISELIQQLHVYVSEREFDAARIATMIRILRLLARIAFKALA